MALILIEEDDTFNEWRLKNNDLGTFVGDVDNLGTTAKVIVNAINEIRSGFIEGTLTTSSSIFRVQVDTPDAHELVLDASGNLTVTGQMTSTQFNGPLVGNVTGNITGNAGTATILQTTRNIALTGDAAWNVNFNGSTNVTGALTLTNSGVVAGTYTKITVDSKGRATSGTALSSADVTTALGYTPWHAGNDGLGSGLDADLLDGLLSSTGAVANTVAVRDGSGNLTANVFIGTATSARYADLAEKYSTDAEYSVGTVVAVAGPEIEQEATASTTFGQLTLGVISEKPAYLMNAESVGQPIALKGRVPVRVVGAIVKGQPISASNTVGCATYGQVNTIGIALETNMDLEEKLVECFIK
jgi:hypothetical protein